MITYWQQVINWFYMLSSLNLGKNMTDEIEQSDEIMALQSIYGDGTFVCNVSEKPFTGKISIFLKTDAEEHNFTCNGWKLLLSLIKIVFRCFLLNKTFSYYISLTIYFVRRCHNLEASYSFDSELFIAIKLSVYGSSRCDPLLFVAYSTAGLLIFFFIFFIFKKLQFSFH